MPSPPPRPISASDPRQGVLVADAPAGWRRVLLRMGRGRAVAVITLGSLVASVGVTVLVNVLLGVPATLPMDLLVAVIVPLIVAPLASYSAMSLLYEVDRARAQLHQVAISDSLTQLYNRRFFMARFDAEVARARRAGHALSIVLIDVDHFKAINDTHGHATGDEVLERLATLLVEAMRPYDLVARFGGEEFVVLMPHADLPQATAAAERIRQAVEAAPITWPGPATGQTRGITASLGVSCLGGPDDRAADLLARADRAMYAAKNSGRNRCVAIAPETVVEETA